MLRDLRIWFLKLIEYEVDYFISYEILATNITPEKDNTTIIDRRGHFSITVKGGVLADDVVNIMGTIARKENIDLDHLATIHLISINRL